MNLKNKVFILNDVDRLKNRDSISNMISNWKVISTDNYTAFKIIISKIFDIINSENNINDSDMLQIGNLIKDTFDVVDDTDYNKKISIVNTYVEKSDNESFLNLLNNLKYSFNSSKKVLSVIHNHEKLNRKIKIEEMVNELKMTNSSEYAIDGIYELCDIICNTYDDITSNQKIGICLENIKYVCNKLFVPIDNESIMYHICEYFIMKNEDVNIMNNIVKNTILYDEVCKKKSKKLINKMKEDMIIDKDDKKNIDGIFLDEPILEKINVTSIKDITEKILKDIKSSKTSVNIKNNVDKILSILYKTPIDDIIDETPHILGFVRRCIIYSSSAAISPYLLLPVVIVDAMIHDKVNKNQCDKNIKNLNKEKANIEKKIKENPHNKNELDKYLDTIKKQIDRIETYKNNLKSDLEIHDDYNKNDDDILREMATILAMEFFIRENVLVENTALTILRTSRENLKKGFEKLSAKEKALSRTLDTTIERLEKDIMTALTIKERERVIKGSILPSASKTIKLAITAGTAYYINPAIAVVGSLAAMAVAKTANMRERQLILDEIEIHLKIVEKKISQAEMNNNAKAVEQLMKLENKLKRERQRIKYRMKVYYNQNV